MWIYLFCITKIRSYKINYFQTFLHCQYDISKPFMSLMISLVKYLINHVCKNWLRCILVISLIMRYYSIQNWRNIFSEYYFRWISYNIFFPFLINIFIIYFSHFLSCISISSMSKRNCWLKVLSFFTKKKTIVYFTNLSVQMNTKVECNWAKEI